MPSAHSSRTKPSSSPILDWLLKGHIQAVIEGGATSGYAILETEPADSLAVVSRYIFPSQEAFDQYVAQTAPKLREEGLRLFGPHTGITMQRSLGTVISPE
ncbi:MAG: DUF4286 family protein [Phycisphaerales bacterium]|nr:DUF4286 family protein [Phycisphaerales bacterium]